MISVRELKEEDIPFITRYWLGSDVAFLEGMGVDPAKVPDKDQWAAVLKDSLCRGVEQKAAYWVIWQEDDMPVGHSNINKIVFGEEAFVHLHLWRTDFRKKGLGTELLKMSLPFYFDNFRLKKLYCEPYALNPAPNKALKNAGFEFIREYETVPGRWCFRQKVNRWEMSREKFREMVCRDT